MKMAESKKLVLVSCVIDFDDMQVCLRQFSLNLNAWKNYEGILDIFRPKFEEDRHNFAGFEIQTILF